MRNSRRLTTRSLALYAALAASVTGCGSYGDPCLRVTDCGSGLVCVEGACVIDLGDNPSDAAVPNDVTSSDVPISGDANRDASTDASDEEGSTPASDSAGIDATRDVVIDGDAADLSMIDAPRDAAEASTAVDDADARASTDSGTGSNDTLSGDVGGDADSGIAKDAQDAADALDAAG